MMKFRRTAVNMLRHHWKLPKVNKALVTPIMYRNNSYISGTFSKTRHNKVNKSRLPLVVLSQAGLAVALWLSFSQRKEILSDSERTVTIEELMKHNTLDDCWISIHGKIYDVSKFLQRHPGGASRIYRYAGRNASEAFSQMHSEEVIEKVLDQVKYIGLLDGEFEEEEITEDELARLDRIANKPPLSHIFNLSDFEYVAKQILPKTTYGYFATGSSDEFTLRENYSAYSRVFFRPKILQDTEIIDTSTTFLGNEVSIPIYITAFAGSLLAHPLGELNLMRAAYREGIIQMVPKLLAYPRDKFFSQVPHDQNQWAQLHFDTQQELDDMPKTVEQFNKSKNIKGIFVNVDLADLGNRERDSKLRAEDEEIAAALSACANNGRVNYPKKFLWTDVLRLRSMTDLPIALKGVQRGEDVLKAAENGIDAVILSNHGGRQLDFSRPSLEVLVEAKEMLKKKGLENKIEIYIDGGIRRGSDIIKALCLGAKGVGLGRPFLYAMCSYGEEGVVRAIQILKTEMRNNMKLLGVSRIEELNEDLVDTSSLKFRNASVNRLYDSACDDIPAPKFKETQS